MRPYASVTFVYRVGDEGYRFANTYAPGPWNLRHPWIIIEHILANHGAVRGRGILLDGIEEQQEQ